MCCTGGKPNRVCVVGRPQRLASDLTCGVVVKGRMLVAKSTEAEGMKSVEGVGERCTHLIQDAEGPEEERSCRTILYLVR